MHIPETDSSEYAALIEFAATSGRSRIHPKVSEKADELVSNFLSGRARAMSQALEALAKAATGRSA